MTEQLLQALVMQRCLSQLKHQVALPNDTSFYSWESDVITINGSGFVSEFECKISRADYLRDKKKPKFDAFKYHKAHKERHDKAVLEGKWDRPFIPHIPNYFWYVTLDFDIEPPEYAGWLKVTYNEKKYWHDVKVMKVAPRLHSDKPHERMTQIAARLLSFKLMSVYVNTHVHRKKIVDPKA